MRAHGRVTEVKARVVFGSPERVAAYLASSPASRTINTSFVERDNLTQRQSNRRLTRKTNGFSKEIAWLEKQLWLSTAYYHLVLPRLSLRQPRGYTRKGLRGIGNQSRQQWPQASPTMYGQRASCFPAGCLPTSSMVCRSSSSCSPC